MLRQGKESIYLLLYVDGIVLTSSSSDTLWHVTHDINVEFKLKDMGSVHYFLSIQVTRCSDGFLLQQQQYAMDLLE